jgi:hypothetical protein
MPFVDLPCYHVDKKIVHLLVYGTKNLYGKEKKHIL